MDRTHFSAVPAGNSIDFIPIVYPVTASLRDSEAIRLLAKLDGRVVSSHTEFLLKECSPIDD